MTGNYSKTPLGSSFNRIATQVTATAVQQFGKALPCSVVAVLGQIVKVKFEINAPGLTLPGSVVMPIATSLYDWLPVQIGDTGVTMPADVYLGGISGLGGGIANLTQRANLTSLVFVPVAKASWSVPNANQRVVQGPAGVLLRDTGAASNVDITTTGITLSFGGHSIVINASGITLDGILWDTHYHTQAADSHGDSEANTSGPV